ncbi:MAG: helix-turn-helix domain-containing protein [Patescibacteria group bacterium]
MNEIKHQAILLRKEGLSYNTISRRLHVAKSTLSGWLSTVPFSENIKRENNEKNKKIQAKNLIAFNKNRSRLIRLGWIKTQKESSHEIGALTERELFLIGASLYWAEGYKKSNWNMVFCNSDPKMIKLMMHYFLHTCSVPRKKIKIQVQHYSNQDEQRVLQYWSRVCRLPLSQFNKPICMVSKSSKLKRGSTLPFGTIRIRINDVTLLNRMKGWIEGIADSNRYRRQK